MTNLGKWVLIGILCLILAGCADYEIKAPTPDTSATGQQY
jgi:hypothetical protein